jgi:uncharacterized protein HemY
MVLAASAWAALVPDVRALLNKGDFPGAEKLIADFQKQNGTTPEMLEAQSWLGRGALAAKQYGKAHVSIRTSFLFRRAASNGPNSTSSAPCTNKS